MEKALKMVKEKILECQYDAYKALEEGNEEAFNQLELTRLTLLELKNKMEDELYGV